MIPRMATGQELYIGGQHIGTVADTVKPPLRLRSPPRLTDAEADCLAIAIRATYMPGVVAVQTRFHGKENLKSREVKLALERLCNRGLLRFRERWGHRDVDTVSYLYDITALGRLASVPVVFRIRGAA